MKVNYGPQLGSVFCFYDTPLELSPSSAVAPEGDVLVEAYEVY